jgi:hypothetical protein
MDKVKSQKLEEKGWKVMEAMDAVADRGDNAASEFLGYVLAENNLFRTIEEILSQPCSLDEVTIYRQTGIHPKTGKPYYCMK